MTVYPVFLSMFLLSDFNYPAFVFSRFVSGPLAMTAVAGAEENVCLKVETSHQQHISQMNASAAEVNETSSRPTKDVTDQSKKQDKVVDVEVAKPFDFISNGNDDRTSSKAKTEVDTGTTREKHDDQTGVVKKEVPVIIDPQLHLLDFQLRHILKPSSRDEFPDMGLRGIDVKSRCGAPSEGVGSPLGAGCSVAAKNGALAIGSMGKDLPKYSHSTVWGHGRITQDGSKITTRLENANSPDGDDLLVVEMVTPFSGSGKAHSEETGGVNAELVIGSSDPPPTLPNSIAFGTSEDLHQEDPQTTNIYIDDHATRAAPYTVASQFVSLGFSDDESNTEEKETASTRPDGTTSIKRCPIVAGSHAIDKLTVGSQCLHKTDWEPNESKLVKTDVNSPRKLLAMGVASHVERKKSLTSNFPRPKFSVRSPSSPARLSSSGLVDHNCVYGATMRPLNGLDHEDQPDFETETNAGLTERSFSVEGIVDDAVEHLGKTGKGIDGKKKEAYASVLTRYGVAGAGRSGLAAEEDHSSGSDIEGQVDLVPNGEEVIQHLMNVTGFQEAPRIIERLMASVTDGAPAQSATVASSSCHGSPSGRTQSAVRTLSSEKCTFPVKGHSGLHLLCQGNGIGERRNSDHQENENLTNAVCKDSNSASCCSKQFELRPSESRSSVKSKGTAVLEHSEHSRNPLKFSVCPKPEEQLTGFAVESAMTDASAIDANRRPKRSLSCGTAQMLDGTGLSFVTIDDAQFTMSSPEHDRSPKPPPGHAHRKAVLSSHAR